MKKSYITGLVMGVLALLPTWSLAYSSAMGFEQRTIRYTPPKKFQDLCQKKIQKLYAKDKKERMEAQKQGCVEVWAKVAHFNQAQYQWIAKDINSTFISSPAAMKKHFDKEIQDYDEFLKESSYHNVFSQTSEVTWISLSPRLAQFRVDYSEFTGGAHANYGTDLRVYDLQKKRVLKLDDILTSPLASKAKLKSLLRQAFQERFNNKENYDAHEKSWEFYVSDEFYFTPTGITFVYDPYGIGPFAMGFVALSLTTEQVKHLIKPEYLGQSMTHFDDQGLREPVKFDE